MSGDVRGQALKAAMGCFAAQGYEGTSLKKIADEVGVTKSAILHHFPSKAHLRQEVLETILAHWKETLPRLLLAATAAENRFDAVFAALYDFFSEDPNRARVILRETMDRPEKTRQILRDQVKTWLDVLASYIKEGQKSGRHHKDVDPESYVFLILRCVLVATSSVSLATSVVGEDAARRQAQEMARIAKSSLFRMGIETPKRETLSREERDA